MAKQLTLKEVKEKYSSTYISLLERHPWIQSYRGKRHSWDEEYKGLWLPPITYLWRLIETFIPVDPEKIADIPAYLSGKLKLKKYKNKFIASLQLEDKTIETKGDCPEDALLQLFITLEKK